MVTSFFLKVSDETENEEKSIHVFLKGIISKKHKKGIMTKEKKNTYLMIAGFVCPKAFTT